MLIIKHFLSLQGADDRGFHRFGKSDQLVTRTGTTDAGKNGHPLRPVDLFHGLAAVVQVGNDPADHGYYSWQ